LGRNLFTGLARNDEDQDFALTLRERAVVANRLPEGEGLRDIALAPHAQESFERLLCAVARASGFLQQLGRAHVGNEWDGTLVLGPGAIASRGSRKGRIQSQLAASQCIDAQPQFLSQTVPSYYAWLHLAAHRA
jgi:hypothetical protein